MKTLLAVIVDIKGTEHVAELSSLPDAPSTVNTAERMLANFKWLKVGDGKMLNMDHVVSFQVKEQD